MTNDQMFEIARGNIERHLGSCVEEGDSADSVFEEAYVLGFDALVDKGVDHHKAGEIAREVAQCYAQP